MKNGCHFFPAAYRQGSPPRSCAGRSPEHVDTKHVFTDSPFSVLTAHSGKPGLPLAPIGKTQYTCNCDLFIRIRTDSIIYEVKTVRFILPVLIPALRSALASLMQPKTSTNPPTSVGLPRDRPHALAPSVRPLVLSYSQQIKAKQLPWDAKERGRREGTKSGRTVFTS